MRTLNYFTANGDEYTLKTQTSRLIILAAVCAAIGGAGIWKGYILLGVIIILLGVVILYRLTASVTFDTKNRTVVSKKGAFGKAEVLPFDNFTGFTLTKVQTETANITTNTDFVMNFDVDGKKKEVLLRQAGRNTQYANTLVEEVEWIMQQGTEKE